MSRYYLIFWQQFNSFSKKYCWCLILNAYNGYRQRNVVSYPRYSLNNRIYDTTGNGLGVDLGLSYSLQKSLYLGVAVYNRLPININWSNGTSEIYPRRTRIGIGWQALVNLLLSADLEQSENQPATYYYGLEYWLTPSLALRGGYNQETYNLGVGLTVYQLTLDVAYSWPVDSNGLDPTFRLSAGKEW